VLTFAFNPQKSAQAAAVLLNLNGGDMDKYLFIKMLYLAGRESLRRWGEPITGDRTASMEYGPVLSTISDLTKGDGPGWRPFWEPFISDADEQTNRVSVKDDPGQDELSKSEIEILKSVHGRFKDFSWKQMRDFCHALPEYEEVGKSSKLLFAERILQAMGKTDAEIKEAESMQRQVSLAEMLLGRG